MKIATQMIKKGGQYLLLLGIVFLVSACGGNSEPMDKKSEDGKYHYQNPDLEFEITLPSTFKKYQTQRKKGENFTSIEILVPTADKTKFKEIHGYAKPVTVRVYNSPQDDYGNFQKIAEGDKGVYTIKFWSENQIPDDWQEKWDNRVKNNIRESFQLTSGSF